MAEVIIFKKFFYYSIMVGSFPIIAQAVAEKEPLSLLATVIIILLMGTTLLPEGLLIFKGYRNEILSGIQDGDGKTNREDMKYFVSWYGPFICLRMLIFFSLFSMVEPSWEPPSNVMWALVAVGTGTALPQIQKLINGK